MHQVVADVDPVERRAQRLGVAEVASHDLDVIAPRRVGEFVRVSGQRTHGVPAFQQLGYQPAADVAGGSRHQAADLIGGHPGSIAVLDGQANPHPGSGASTDRGVPAGLMYSTHIFSGTGSRLRPMCTWSPPLASVMGAPGG